MLQNIYKTQVGYEIILYHSRYRDENLRYVNSSLFKNTVTTTTFQIHHLYYHHVNDGHFTKNIKFKRE